MSAEEELKEHSAHARDPFDKRVAATMAIIAALLAVVSLLGHLANTEELIKQQKASDQWSYYQAKSIRRYASEVARDLFAGMNNPASSELYAKNSERYRSDGEEIQKKAEDFEKESEHRGQQALCLHCSEVFFEISIVFASLAILTKRASIWYAAIIGTTIGVVIAACASIAPEIAGMFSKAAG